jgi:hypothetical protein
MPKKMTLFDLVRQECCNFVSDECLGIELFSNKRFKEEGGKCWIIDEGTQCDFFVRCVLPLAPELSEKYREIDSSIKEAKRCSNCGNKIGNNERKCTICKRKTRRLRNRKFRGV